ncbi:MAG: AAA family ATPase [Ignavibacteriae bacterium]|nr:AAA family ATPase [Ignavibacteriota bacterium]
MNVSKTDLVDQLEDYQERKNLSWNEVSRKIGISPSIISSWRKNSYTGNNDDVNIAVDRFLRIENSKLKGIKKDLEFVEINNTKKFLSVLKTCHRDGIIAAIVGDTGTSKTTSIELYESENDVVKISANRSFKFPIEYIKRIHTQIGKNGIGTMNKLFQDVVNELKGKNILIIIDQCDYLNLSAIDIFRSLNDESGVGIVFVGLPSFLATLRGNEPEVKQVKDRIRMKLELKKFSQNDCDEILDKNWPELNGLKTEFYKHSNGSIRILSALIYHCRLILSLPKNKDVKISAETISKASMFLERANLG